MVFQVTNRETKRSRTFESVGQVRNYLLREYRAVYGEEAYREILTYALTLGDLAAMAGYDILADFV